MSYLVYINGILIDLDESRPLSQTKQVNDMARLDNRQSNFTNNFRARDTENNRRAFAYLGLVGNQSNIPYQKNTAKVFDSETGEALVVSGWANIRRTTNGMFEVFIVDGIIDFYKAIENKTVSDIGVEALNHTKDLPTIIDSWNDDKPYLYIIADYNGKVYTDDSKLNADYLVPCVRKSYLWNRIHEYAGFTYSGDVFQTEKFLNNFITFPKPVPTTDPVVTLITNQENGVLTGGSWFGGLGGFNSFGYSPNFFPNNFDTAEANNNQFSNQINIETTGTYRLTAEGQLLFEGGSVLKEIYWRVVGPDGSISSQGTIDSSIGQQAIIQAQSGDRIMLWTLTYQSFWGSGSISTKFELIVGYSANFEDVLVDLTATEVINQIMVEFGLTAFKDKSTNHIVYKTLNERLQTATILDWTDKFLSRKDEKYQLSNYAQLNKFKYRYNDENATHFDGSFTINDENLRDEVTVFQSKFYAPDNRESVVATKPSFLFKLWEKEVKDDGSIEYKDLDGRYYALRAEFHNIDPGFILKSEALNNEVTFTTAPFVSYWRLKMQQIIFDNYLPIESILDKTKIVEDEFWLDIRDVSKFDFDCLIYNKYMGSYYLPNRIIGYTPGQSTRVELIEVDYFKELDVPDPIDYELDVINDNPIDYVGCQATFVVDTNIPVGSTVTIKPFTYAPDGLGGFIWTEFTMVNPITAVYGGGSVIVVSIYSLPVNLFGYKFKLVWVSNLFETIESSLSNTLFVEETCYVPVDPPAPELTFLTITNVQTISITGGLRKVKVSYTSDLTDTSMMLVATAYNQSLSGLAQSQTFYLAAATGFVEIEIAHNSIAGGPALHTIQLNAPAYGVSSNIVPSAS